jgi:membrane protease YdiL (CAAX protease family)
MNVTIAKNRPATIAGLALALGWPLVLAAFVPHQNLAHVNQDVTVIVAECVSVLVLAAIVVFWERLPLFSTVGLTRPRPVDWIFVVGLVLVAVAAAAILAHNHVTVSSKGSILGQVVAVPLALRIALVLTAGVCEEILFRGYAIERLRALTGNVWIAALVGTVLFTLAHVPRYGLTQGLAGVFVVGAILSAIYVWRRNLLACIVLHWFVDGFSLLLLPALVTIKP